MSARLPRVAAAAAAAVCVAATGAGALAAQARPGVEPQVQAVLEAGGGDAGVDHTARSAVLTIAPAVRAALGQALHVEVDGAYSDYGGARWGARGSARLSAFASLGEHWRIEGSGRGAASTGAVGRWSTAWDLGGRLHLLGERRGVWIGAGPGYSSESRLGQAFFKLQGGVWARQGPVQLDLSIGNGLAVGDSVQQIVPWPDSSLREDTVWVRRRSSFTDVSAALAWTGGALELGAGLGQRLSALGSGRTWWNLDATYWASPSLAIVAATGRYPAELPLALPGGRYTTLSLRVPLGSSRATPNSEPPAERPRPAALATFAARRLSANRVLLTVTAPEAGSVEVMGDFTDWRPVALAPADAGRWQVTVPIPRGLHQVNVRYDGGAWQIPPGTTPVADDFGGAVGVFVVE